jgi:CheY-like chemotaxis protein
VLKTNVDTALAGNLVGDSHRIRQVLFNLLGNAIKFTETGGLTFHVEANEVSENGVKARFLVKDTGIGISSESRVKIFNAFGQADTSTSRRFGGTGLGLPIADRLVALMGGQLTLESQPGQGSEFSFILQLPWAVEQIITACEAPEDDPSEQPIEAHVLLVEDNLVNQEVALEMLEGLGLRVTAVADGNSALAAFQETALDIILMDLHMPGLNGYEVTRAIRELEQSKKIAKGITIVALTADVVQDVRDECRSVGMDDYLSKPFTRQELRALLLKWLHRPPTGVHEQPPIHRPQNENTGVLDQEVLDQLRSISRPGAPPMLKRVFDIYQRSAPDQLSDIRQAIEQGCGESLKQVAHSLKSSSANLGARRLSDLCQQLERMGAGGDLGGAGDLIKQLEIEYAETVRALRELVAQQA